jgi:O-methyltransferase
MKRFIQGILDKLGYEIIKRDSGLPSRQTLNSNLYSLITAYEQLFKQVENININENALRNSLIARGRGTRPPEAFEIIKALVQTRNIEGDICEFGVAQGETSALIANEIRETKKIFHLFDSFQGLSQPTSDDTLKDDIFSLGQMQAYFGTMKCSKNQVISRLNDINYPTNQFFIHEGFIEDTFRSNINLPVKVSFAYIDFDLYSPTKSTLEFLESRTEAGAVVIIDDYDFFSTGVKKAVDEFIQKYTKFKIQIPHPDFGQFAILHRQL